LREQAIVARRAYESAELAVDVQATIGGINKAFGQLEGDLPELIIFEVPPSVLKSPEQLPEESRMSS
jgi:hypothetical protein